MTNEELKSKLTALLPSIQFDESGEWLNILIQADELTPFIEQIKSDPDLNFNYLFCLTCIDWKTHLQVVYHLSSTQFRHTIVIKAKTDRTNPEIQTVSSLWRTAELLEREVYEMFGVNFLNHPDLRRLILPDDWQGWPLRKDYEDPINSSMKANG